MGLDDLVEHRKFTESLDWATQCGIKALLFIQEPWALSEVHDIVIQRALKTLEDKGRHVQSKPLKSDELHSILGDCSGKLCWSTNPRQKIPASNLDTQVPTVHLSGFRKACPHHTGHKKIFITFKCNTAAESRFNLNQGSYIDESGVLYRSGFHIDVRATIFSTDLERANQIIEDVLVARFTTILQQHFGYSPGEDYVVAIMDSATQNNSGQDLECTGADCSSHSSNHRG